MIQSDPSYAKAQVEKRDKGICWECWIDTRQIRRTFGILRRITSQGISAYPALLKQVRDRAGVNDHEIWAAIEWAYYRRSERHRAAAIARHGDRAACGRSYPPRTEPTDQDHEIEDWILAVDSRIKKLARARRKRLRTEFCEAGWEIDSRTVLWDMDHINPVIRGGGSCGLENLRTLCIPCHKRMTRELARRRASERVGQPELQL